jgi:hypothetical protein
MHNKAGKCKSHLAKCSAYECPPCNEPPVSEISNTLVVHDKCIEVQQVLQREKSTLEQKLDNMSQQLKEQSEQAQRHTSEIIRHADKRWSSFSTVMVKTFPTLKEPINERTIPAQMRERELSFLCEKSAEQEGTRLEIKRLKTTNHGLVEDQQTLNEKFRSVIQQRDGRVDVETYKRTLAERDKLKKQVVSHGENIKKLKTEHGVQLRERDEEIKQLRERSEKTKKRSGVLKKSKQQCSNTEL